MVFHNKNVKLILQKGSILDVGRGCSNTPQQLLTTIAVFIYHDVIYNPFLWTGRSVWETWVTIFLRLNTVPILSKNKLANYEEAKIW